MVIILFVCLFLHAWVGEYVIVLEMKPSELNPVAELEDNMTS